MHHLTPQQKHDILKLYSPYDHTRSFAALSQQYNIKGGERVIRNWYHQWTGSPKSLERKRGSGRHKLLTSQQVKDLIQIPIRNKNRSFKPVHYPQLHSSIQQKTGKQMTLRTVQKIGKEELGVKQKRTKKRTAQERKQT